MLSKLPVRLLHTTSNLWAKKAPVIKPKTQSFSRKQKNSFGRAPIKKIAKTSMYKNWSDTIQSGNYSKNITTAVPLPEFNIDDLESPNDKLTTYSSHQLKHLNALGSFKANQFRELFPNPICIIRESTILKLINQLTILDNQQKKFVLTGEPGVGKSTLLTQLHAWALNKKYLIINLSHPRQIMDGLNDFKYNDNLKLYEQPMFLKSFIRQILTGNDSELLKSIALQNDYEFSRTYLNETKTFKLSKGGSSLRNLLSIRPNSNLLGMQFESIINEIYSQKEVPVLFTVDNFSYILTNSFTKYSDTESRPIPALKFQIVDKIMKIISGEIPLINPLSAIVTSISGEDKTNHTLPVALGKKPLDPYISQSYLDQEYVKLLQTGRIREFKVNKMNKEEISTLINYCTKLNIPFARDNCKTIEEITNEKYFISGNGNCREFFRSITLNYR